MRFTGVGGTLRRPWLGGMRGVVGVAALAAGLLLALSMMPGCSLGCPTPEQRAYLNEVGEWSDRAEAASRDLHTVLEELESRPEAFIDDEWRRRLKRAMDDWDSAGKEMMAIGSPPGTEELHRVLVQTSRAYSEANEMLWQGVLDVDAKTIDKSNETRAEANRLLFEELLPTAERFCE